MKLRKACRRRYALILAASMAVANASRAAPVLSEQDYFEELPVVLSVSRLAQPLDEAPGAVTVIDREMIRLSGARQLVDLLRLVPGFQVSEAPNGVSAGTTAFYHGLTETYARHMQVLVDGRSQYSPFFIGGVNWNLIPVSLDDIERIEVVRGSNSAAYGSNAVLGVVNVITRHALETQGASAEVHSGGHGVNDKRIRVGAAGQDAAIRLTAETRQDTGLSGFRDDIAQRLVDARIDWRLSMRDELQLQFGEAGTALQIGSGSATDPLRKQDQTQRYFQVGWRRALGEGEDLGVRYYRSEESAVDAFTAIQAPFVVPIDYGFRSVRNDLEASHTFVPWVNTRLVWGGELRSDSVRAPMFYGRQDDVSLDVARLFGNLEWRPAPDWVANVGATWERDTNSKTTFAPRVAANWHVAPGQTLRAGVTRAYRTPSLFETRGDWKFVTTNGLVLKRNILAQDTVLPETLASRELGWMADFKPLRLTGDVRVFQEQLSDRQVTMDMASVAASRVFNAQNVTIRGIEYQFRWQPFETTRAILNQSFIRVVTDFLSPAGMKSTYNYGADTFQTDRSAPTHATTFMLMQRLPGGLDLSAIYHSIGASRWTNQTEAPHWQRLDWRLGYPFRIGSTRGEFAVTVQSDGGRHIEHAKNTGGNTWLDEYVTPRGYLSLRLDF